MGKSEFIVPDSFALINKLNGTNSKYVCKLYDRDTALELFKNPREPKRNSRAQLYLFMRRQSCRRAELGTKPSLLV